MTKVEPLGKFREHINNYHHLFIILEGEIIFRIEDEEILLNQYMALEISAGISHSYVNESMIQVYY